jgi:hypothetical protein
VSATFDGFENRCLCSIAVKRLKTTVSKTVALTVGSNQITLAGRQRSGAGGIADKLEVENPLVILPGTVQFLGR